MIRNRSTSPLRNSGLRSGTRSITTVCISRPLEYGIIFSGTSVPRVAITTTDRARSPNDGRQRFRPVRSKDQNDNQFYYL